MNRKRIFILNGHPAETSLSRTLAQTYANAAKAKGHEVRITHLPDLEFDMDYGFAGYSHYKPLEPGLADFQADIEWAEHIVMTTPMWWGGLPAKLKGLIDRTLLPGWAFDTRNLTLGMPSPMLKGRTARAIVTSDTPSFFFGLLYRNALLRQIKGQVFHVIGWKSARITHFATASHADEKKIKPWLNKVEKLAHKGI